MKKGIILAGVAVSVAAEAAIHAYMDIMARESKVKSIASIIGESINKHENQDMLKFNTSKLMWIEEQNIQNISITSQRGDLLKGYLTVNESPSNVFVLFAHGYRSDHNGDPANFMRYYLEKGCNFLSVDHVSHGKSGGKYIGFDYFESKDCLDWIDYLISRFGNDIKIILHGVSMGGATVCKMADKVPEQVKFAVADCPYTSALEEFDAVIKGTGFRHTGTFLKIFNEMNKRFAGYDLKETDVRESVKNAKIPMLFVHGAADTFVPTRMGIELYELCRNKKELMLVEDAPHAESIRYNEIGYHKKLDEFIDKYL